MISGANRRPSAGGDLRHVLRSGDATLLQQAGSLLYTKLTFANNRTDGVRNFGVSHDFMKLVRVHPRWLASAAIVALKS